MKFLLVSNHSHTLWQFRRELIERLCSLGEVVLVMPLVGREEDFAAMGCRLIPISVDRRGTNPATDLRLLLRLGRILKAERPDLTLTFSIKPNLYAGIFCRFRNLPYCAHVQGLGSAFQKALLARFVTAFHRIALKRAKTVFFENEEDAASFAERGILTRERCTVLRGAGVNLQTFAYLPYPSEASGIRFLFLGRIMREKGMDELLAASAALKRKYGARIHVEVAGFFEDSYRARVQALSEAGIISYHGFAEDPRELLAVAHCVVLPSYHEGMSNALLEAAACGRALIASDIPGCRETMEADVSGFLCRKADADDLARQMERFLSLTPEAREQMGKAGRRHVMRDFDRNAVVDTTVQTLLAALVAPASEKVPEETR